MKSAIEVIETLLINTQHIQRPVGDVCTDMPVALDLGEVPYPAQQPVGNARRSPGPAGDFLGAARIDANFQDTGGALHDVGEVRHLVKLQSLHDTEAVAQR